MLAYMIQLTHKKSNSAVQFTPQLLPDLNREYIFAVKNAYNWFLCSKIIGIECKNELPKGVTMKKIITSAIAVLLLLTAVLTAFTSCGNNKKEIVIYTSLEDYRVEYFQKRLNEQFPDYKITVEYKSSGDLAAVLKASGKSVACDIFYNLDCSYAQELAEMGIFADMSDVIDSSCFTDDMIESDFYVPQERNGGSIILNKEVIAKKGLDIPTSYEDLLDPQYQGLISMPNPASSGTGYMFLLSLVNAWGEEAAFEYFDKLSKNVLQFTTSGSGPVNALVSGEAAIGLGMTSQAVTKINEGANLELTFFEQGSPYSLYCQGVISGKENDEAVMEVFKFMATTLTEENNELYYPEKLYKDKDVKLENFPENIVYADMSNNTSARKEELLAKWKY